MRPLPAILGAMPACDARYDVIYSTSGTAIGHEGTNFAIVDMAEERLPDEWGEPGRLLDAHLVRWWAHWSVKSIGYDKAPPRGRKTLWINGGPRRVRANRRYLRWHLPDWDPPVDPCYDDPA